MEENNTLTDANDSAPSNARLHTLLPSGLREAFSDVFDTPIFGAQTSIQMAAPGRQQPFSPYHRTGPASSLQNIHRRVSTYGDVPIEYRSMPVSRRSSRTR